jgi:predicted nucleic acid-binding protein
MRSVFADSFFFFALTNPNDPAHFRATEFIKTYSGMLVTTGWVLTELADGWAKPTQRAYLVLVPLLAKRHANPNARIEPLTDALFSEGIRLYGQRLDKDWSLTDCISFVVMQRDGIIEALTGDHHFEQAGFVALLK